MNDHERGRQAVNSPKTRRDGAREARTAALLACVIALLASACAQSPPPPGRDVLLPMTLPGNFSPEPRDYAAAQMAAAALGGDQATMQRALAEVILTTDPKQSPKLVPLCRDLENATLDDAAAYRAASKQLRRHAKQDPVLAARLDMDIKNDRLKIARTRIRDGWERLWARTFNAVAEPIGSTVITGFIAAPFSLANAGVHYLAGFSNEEPLSTTGRQALTLHKEYVARYPASEETAKLEGKIEKAEAKFHETLRKRRLREAKASLRRGYNRLAMLQAERALRHGPSTQAEQIHHAAQERIARRTMLRSKSLAAADAPPPDADDQAARDVALALLTSSSRRRPLSGETLDIVAAYEETDEAQYILAMAQLEAGYEDESWRRLALVASHDADESHMARHARHLVGNPWQDPYAAFLSKRRQQSFANAKFRLLGQWATRPRYPNLNPALAYLIDTPALAQTILTAPIRLIFGNWNKGPDFQRPTAVLAYRYLGRVPEGQHAREVMDWLYDYERNRGNSIAALRMADFLPNVATKERAGLVEASAAQALAAAERSRRFDRRNSMLRNVVREFPETPSGEVAGRRAREELSEGSAQKIRLSGSFLIENPQVSGPRGLGMNPILLNGKVKDGEIHPLGVTLLGGRHIELALIGESGDEDDEPELVHRILSEDHLAQLASILDETARKNQLIDIDDKLEPDGDRDQFLERARLGLADRPDQRASARSTYVYKSMRERYGVVRGRESILPFDIVLRGSFNDLSLGAFPRWRMPKETPDAFLYR